MNESQWGKMLEKHFRDQCRNDGDMSKIETNAINALSNKYLFKEVIITTRVLKNGKA